MTDTVVETPEVAEKPAKTATPCACSLYTGKDATGADLSTNCEAVTVRTFGPGHDAKLKSILIKTAIAGAQVTKTTTEGTSALSPLHAAEEYGFRNLVEKGVATHQGKAEKREAAAAERQAKKEARDAEKAAKKAERQRVQEERKAKADALKAAADKANAEKAPGPATAKVGSEQFEGVVLNDGTFRYTNTDGEEVETEKFTIVIDPSTVTVDAN